MPFALVTIGLLLVITGFQNTYRAFGAQLKTDLTGKNNFFYWIAAIMIIGSIGYIKDLQKFSRVFLGLILVVIFLKNKNFANAFTSAIGTGSSAKPDPAGGDNPDSNFQPEGGDSGSSGILGGLGAGDVSAIASLAGVV